MKMKLQPSEQKIIDVLNAFPDGLSPAEIVKLLDMPVGTVSSRLCELNKRGLVERPQRDMYKMPQSTVKRPQEHVESRTEQRDIPAYMKKQAGRTVTMYSITRLDNVMRMRLSNGAKSLTVPLIGQSIRIHIGNDVQEWPFSEMFTGYTVIEFTFSNGKANCISVSSDDVITVALEN